MISAISSTVPPARVPPGAASASPVPPRGCSSVSWAVRPRADLVPRVRASLRSTLEGWKVDPDRVEVLLLVATELVSNAVRHAGAVTRRLRITLALGEGWLQLDVADGDPALPRIGPDVERPALEAESGRGLLIVGLLIHGSEGELAAFRAELGKVVRARIPASGGCSR